MALTIPGPRRGRPSGLESLSQLREIRRGPALEGRRSDEPLHAGAEQDLVGDLVRRSSKTAMTSYSPMVWRNACTCPPAPSTALRIDSPRWGDCLTALIPSS